MAAIAPVEPSIPRWLLGQWPGCDCTIRTAASAISRHIPAVSASALHVSEFGLFEQPIDSAGSAGLKVLSRDPFNFGIVRHAARSPLRPGLRNARPVVNASTRMAITVMVVSQSMAPKTVADVSHSQWPAPVLAAHLWYC